MGLEGTSAVLSVFWQKALNIQNQLNYKCTDDTDVVWAMDSIFIGLTDPSHLGLSESIPTNLFNL